MNNQNLMAAFQQFRQNPGALLSRMGIPQQYLNNPNGAIQYLMDSGKISQAQYNQAMQMARSNPLFAQFFR